MSDLNAYSFTGRLGNPAELKFTQGGKPVLSMSVAVGYGYGDNKGTNWIRVAVFGNRAESLGKLELQKGAQVAICGELRLREYDNRDGGKSWAHEVIANEVALIGGKPSGGTSSNGGRGGAPSRQKPETEKRSPVDDFEDDKIPF